MDPRIGLLAVLSTALADGIPEVQRRVDVMRLEPIWGEEELPIILLDLDDERIEERATSPRDYKHTLPVNVVVYCKGSNPESRVSLLRLISSVERIMREWQYVMASDVDLNAVTDGDYRLIEELRKGNSINYFKLTGGNEDHVAARLAYEADFGVSGSASGEELPGAPDRNVLADFREMMATMSHGQGSAIDHTYLS